MKTYRVMGTWSEQHACDCEFCSREEKRSYIDTVVTGPDKTVAAGKALLDAGLDVSFGKWVSGSLGVRCLGEDELMRMRGEPELPGL